MTKETTLRVYQKQDIAQIVEMCARCIPELPHYKGITVAKDRLEYVLKHNLNVNSGFQCWVLVDGDKVVGMACGYCVQGMISWDYIANDSFLYIEEEYRTLARANAMIGAYKKWAQDKGASVIIASTRSGYRPEEFAVFMKRNGFDKMGEVYTLKKAATGIEQELASLKEE